MAVSPALNVAVNYKGQATRFADTTTTAIYESAVNAAKSPQGPEDVATINSVADIQTFIENNEVTNGPVLHVYSDVGVPAIGYGSDLKEKNTGQVNAAFETIINQYLLQHPEYKDAAHKQKVTFTDFLNKNPHATIDATTAELLFQSGFQVAEGYVTTNFPNLTLQEEAALINLVYNVGTKGLTKFKSMVADINQGDFATRTGVDQFTQDNPGRRNASDADFYLLTSGHYDEL